jgi:hypothetical protein
VREATGLMHPIAPAIALPLALPADACVDERGQHKTDNKRTGERRVHSRYTEWISRDRRVRLIRHVCARRGPAQNTGWPDGSFAAFDGDDQLVTEEEGADDLYRTLVAKIGLQINGDHTHAGNSLEPLRTASGKRRTTNCAGLNHCA